MNKKHSFFISIEGVPYVIVCIAAAVVCCFFTNILAVLFLFVAAFTAFFFRNPHREITADDSYIVSPADGVILSIKEISNDDYVGGEAVKISIFLSLFNVHVNRAPINGTVGYLYYKQGKCIPAFKSHASEINERNYIGIENNNLKVMVIQITGFVARRIVCWAQQGDNLNKGDRFGLIKFGSCTELIVPKEVVLLVERGDKVYGGKSVIGKMEKLL